MPNFKRAGRNGCWILLLFAWQMVWAAPFPRYHEVARRLPVLWAGRYPVKVHKFIPNPEGRGILTAIYKGRRVYYYHFAAIVYRPNRRKDGKLRLDTTARRVELWVRYRPWKKEPEQWDLSFARRDLLPGKNRRWLR